MSEKQQFDCAVIGNWHLAYVTSACLADLGHNTALVTTEESGTGDASVLPVYEPGLAELIENSKKAGRFHFIEGVTPSWTAKYVWLAIDTPVNADDEVDLTPLDLAISQISANKNSTENTLILSSQIPLGYCEKIEKEYGLKVVYIPENLRLGKGIETFTKADRTVIGTSDEKLGKEIQTFLAGLQTDYLFCDLATAEMVKHATNAFLATSISFANELARIGEKFGVDNQAVGQALRMDKRIGKQAYVVAGLGFAGGTLPRDLRVLQKLGRDSKTPTPLVDAVLNINESTTKAVSEAVSSYCGGTVQGKKILILGYTYKAETNTLRRSLSIDLAGLFKGAGAEVWGHDPMMNGADLSAFGGNLQHFENWESIPSCPDVVVIMTAREQFPTLSWKSLATKGSALTPLIVDVRGIISERDALNSGFSYKALWQPISNPRNEPQGVTQ